MLLIAAAVAASDPAPDRTVLATLTHRAAQVCHENGSDEIVVCGHARSSPYRLPALDPRFAPHDALPATQGRLASGDVGATGVGSCSTVGPGGATGCSLKEANAWGAWKAEEKRNGRSFPW